MHSRYLEYLNARPVAIVGASADRSKYGNIILRNLRERGWDVFAVNPRDGTIEQQPAYASVGGCPQRPELAVMVTPPRVSEEVLDEIVSAGIPKVWFQEGSFDERVIEKARHLGLDWVDDACIMVMASRLAS